MPTIVGELDRAAVQSALHKHFVQHHHWYVRDLSDAGKDSDANLGVFQIESKKSLTACSSSNWVLMGLISGNCRFKYKLVGLEERGIDVTGKVVIR